MGLLDETCTLITGAGRGIGRGIAEAVAEAGGGVAVTDVDLEAAVETASRVEAKGSRAVAVRLDVTDPASVKQAVDESWTRLGGLDGLVNNAGLLIMTAALDAADSSQADWERQFAVNVEGVVRCCRELAQRWIDAGRAGRIVNVASNAGKVGYANMAAYNASKAAVISLTRSLAGEWAEHGVNVNAVCPGGVATPMLGEVAEWVSQRVGGDAEELLAAMTPAQLGRHVQPIEVGRVVAFLLSAQATIIRGQAINVDGGDTPY